MNATTTTTNGRAAKTIGFTALKGWLRHRHPMILIDRVSDHEPGAFLTAVMSISGALDTIAGHFPERAIYPGTSLLQGFAQTGIVLFLLSTEPLADEEVTLVTSMESRFFHVVVPGDRVVVETKVERLLPNAMPFSGVLRVDGGRVAAARATIVRVPAADLRCDLW